MKEDFMETKQM